MIYKYLDASRYQGKIDWEAVKRSGKIDGAILKTVSTNKSFGGVYIDPQFERNYSECTRLGIPVGAYYYTYAQNEATRAVELVKVKQALMGKSFQLPETHPGQGTFRSGGGCCQTDRGLGPLCHGLHLYQLRKHRAGHGRTESV